MLDEIQVTNFKSFKAQTIPLSRLTVLTGMNNSGKSTAIQALRMCAASTNSASPFLPGLGAYIELKSSYAAAGAPIVISVKGHEIASAVEIRTDGFHRSQASGFSSVQFISADRYGPKVELPTLPDDGSMLHIGEKGEYTAHYATIFENLLVADQIRHPGSSSNILKHQLVAWMGEIAPGIRFSFAIEKKFDASRLDVDGVRATNTGFGVSYALPIVVALLAMSGVLGPVNDKVLLNKQGALLLVENPEAHLHPHGQTVLGKMIAHAASTGLQIVVETHSDHLLDGIRLAMKNSAVLTESDVKILFFQKPSDGPSQIQEILLRKNGKLDKWPAGFFDEQAKNLRALG